ncbi:hypothetical protein BDZ85DRAFT_268596 [Elsinoe ampelina]|uniref:Uncharacterized protein n=1 Tax=Elsinoe ampelina TaxID=302913 RepID=A0A6A6G1N8_9PEZI|nr:hypothetical protein BDZ85DRAFT_268596 [Elsinoe ampelina]
MSDDWDRPRRREDRRGPRNRSVEVQEYERHRERPSRRQERWDDYEDDKHYSKSRYETALVPIRKRDDDPEDRYREEKVFAVAPYHDERGRPGELVIYDDDNDEDRSRSRSRRHRDDSRHKHHKHKHTGMDKSKCIPQGRCWYSEKDRKDADFLEKHFDSSYDGIIAAAAGAAIGAMTANRFSKERKKRNVAASAVAGAVAFNFAENHYRVFTEDEEYYKNKVKTKVKEKVGV